MTGQTCRVCGCTNEQACYREAGLLEPSHLVLDDGTPLITCGWAEPDLCTACVRPRSPCPPEVAWIHPADQVAAGAATAAANVRSSGHGRSSVSGIPDKWSSETVRSSGRGGSTS